MYNLCIWRDCALSPFSTLVFRRRWRKISPAKNLISCSFVPSAKGRTEEENFQRLDLARWCRQEGVA